MDPQIQKYIDDKFQEISEQFRELERLFLEHQHRGVNSDQTKPTSPEIIVGYVNLNGTPGTPFPAGWASENTATGRYTVTHGIGNEEKYVVTVIPRTLLATYADVADRADDDFDVRLYDDAGADDDAAFMFIVVKYPV